MRKLTLSLAVLAALLPLRGYPLGLGDIELNSALNQNLNARIDVVSSSRDDLDSLIVKLADREAFSRVGLDRPFVLQQLKFEVVEQKGQLYIKVFTKSPVQEPYLSFLVEIDWPKGHLLREYTLLLDPPVYNSGSQSGSSRSFSEPADAQAQFQSAEQQQSPGGYQSGAQTGAISPPSGGYDTQYQRAPQTNATAVGEYRIQKNDALWNIAERMRPDSGVSVEQMMLALLRRNPEAFIRENINGIKRGYILRAPSREEITSIDRQRAVALAREHTALWREYSRAAVSNSPASSLEADMPGGAAADQPRDVDGHLSIVGAAEGSEFSASNQDANAELERLKQDLAMAREELESAKLEKQNLRTRLAELEQQVQSAIQMDDEGLAKLQSDLQKQPTDTVEPEVVVEEEVLVEETIEDVVSENIAEEESATDEMTGEALAEGGALEAAGPEEDMEEGMEEVFVDETEEGVEEAGDQPSEIAGAPVDEIEPPAFAQKQPGDLLENLMNDPRLLGIIGGSLAFVFLLIALLLKRLRGGKSDDDEWTADEESEEVFNLGNIEDTVDDPTRIKPVPDMETTAEMQADPAASTSGLGPGDTHVEEPGSGSSLEDTVFSLADDVEEEEEEVDDVLSEAGVYISYGIFQQAEELLTGAIDKDSERDDYRLKLLEVYYTSKNATAFESLAEEAHRRKGDDKAYWDRVVAMGMEVCPSSSLFSGSGGALSDFDAEALLPEKHEPADLDLEADGSLADDDMGGLDELDLESDLENITESIASEAQVETETAAESDEELEFDLGELDEDLGSSEDGVLDSDSSDLDIDDDFSLDFDASDLGFEEPEEDADASLDADLDLGDIDDISAEIDVTADQGAEMDLDMDDSDPGITGLDADEIDVSDLEGMDLEGMDLDSSIDDSMGADISIDDDFDISELSEDIDEVSTKLDLARAYIDMGDSEGARSILEEVKAEGTNEQQKEADSLLQKAS